MQQPSLELIRTALIVMGISTVCLALGIYFMMQVRYSRDIAREARRLMFADLIVPPWDGKNLESLWISSSRQDREIIENVLAGQSQFLEGKEAATFERAVTGCGIYGS